MNMMPDCTDASALPGDSQKPSKEEQTDEQTAVTTTPQLHTHPLLCLSSREAQKERIYVQVQINSSSTISRLRKSNRADCNRHTTVLSWSGQSTTVKVLTIHQLCTDRLLVDEEIF